MLSTSTVLAGRYRLDEVIGRGGMSIVYRATDLVLDRTVAVKVLLPALAEEDPAWEARFEREARAAAAVSHRGVAMVYDTGEEDGTRFIVMECVAGESLAKVLLNRSPLPVADALSITEQVADTLAAAHAVGVIHRDIKPANVMVGPDGTVKILDFGIAWAPGAATITNTASVLGTAAYMAPERAMGQAADARSDIYSLGCLLYAMLTGAPPFSGDVAAAVLHQQVNASPRTLREVNPRVPLALEELVGEMLAKSPAERPPTAGEVGDRLRLVGGADATAPTQRLDETARTRVLEAGAVPVAQPSPASFVTARGRRVDGAALLAIIGALALAAIAIATGVGSSSKTPVSHTTGTVVRPPPHTTTHPRAVTPAPSPIHVPATTPLHPGHPGHGPTSPGPPPGKLKKHGGGEGHPGHGPHP